MSALVAEAAEAPPRPIQVLEGDSNIFPSVPSDDDSAPLSPATDYDDQTEEPLSPCGSDNGLLASSEGEIRVGPSVTRPTAVEPTSTPPPPILTDLDAPTCVICLEALDDNSDNPGVAVPCACQRNLDQPTRVHESCLRTWVGACAQRAARRGSDDQPANAFAARRAAARRARSLENQADVQ